MHVLRTQNCDSFQSSAKAEMDNGSSPLMTCAVGPPAVMPVLSFSNFCWLASFSASNSASAASA